MSLPSQTDAHSWVLVDYDDPDQHEVCTQCGAQRNSSGPLTERATVTGGWPSPVDCELLAALVDPEKAIENLSPEERAEHKRCQQSVIDARRAGERIARETWIG